MSRGSLSPSVYSDEALGANCNAVEGVLSADRASSGGGVEGAVFGPNIPMDLDDGSSNKSHTDHR